MINKMLKIALSFILLFIIFMQNQAWAISSKAGYTIDKYDVDMIVNEDNTFDITETITVNFSEARHGIFRKIPLSNTITRNDGTTSKNRAKVRNISSSDNYTTSIENSNKVIKIGDEDKTITGKHIYTIKYTYDIGKDPLKDADELYYNIIGTEWDTTISNVSFKIKMPKEFDESLLGFSSGSKGSVNNSNVLHSVDNNIITGSLVTSLQPEEGLTVRLTLPENYFTYDFSKDGLYYIAVIILSVICAGLSINLWSKYGKDEEVIETVEFYPPEGYNSADVDFLYEGKSSTKGVISLLIYLANLGYLKIEETEEKVLFAKTKGFRITKVKEYDGENENEKLFFNGLFRSKNSVTASDLYDRFYTTVNKIKTNLNSKENKNEIFEEKASKQRKWILLMMIVVLLLITVKPVIDYIGFELLPIVIIFPGVGLAIALRGLLGKSTIIVKIFSLIWGLIFGGVPWAVFMLPILFTNNFALITYIVGIICFAILVVMFNIMPKRTNKGNELYGKIKGFKNFLITAEKEQLEDLVEKEPEYFYNILPYTYALGVSDKWVKQFETIAIEAPDWYSSPNGFSTATFASFMSQTMSSASSAMSSSPSSGGSGGGSSGGGSGGGRRRILVGCSYNSQLSDVNSPVSWLIHKILYQNHQNQLT